MVQWDTWNTAQYNDKLDSFFDFAVGNSESYNDKMKILKYQTPY